MPPEPETDLQEAPADDIRSSLLAAFDEHEASADTSDASEKPAVERARAPDGKFVKSDEPDAPVIAPTGETPPIAPEVTPAIPAAPTVELPSRWSAADKEAFSKIPTEAQDFVMRRYKDMEADYTRKTTEIAAFRRDYEPVQQMMAPFEKQIRDAGFTPATLIQAWAEVEKDLTGGRGIQVVRNLVQNYKLDRAALARELGLTSQAHGEAPPAPEGQQTAYIPPELTQTIQSLQQQQSQFNQFLTRQQEQQQAEATNRAMSTVTAFRDAKDPSGNLLHPHFDEIEADMADFATLARNKGQELNLDELYEKAVRANPSTYEKLLASRTAAQEAQRIKAEQERATEARAKAERARRAGSSVTGAPGSSQAAIAAAKAESGSIRDALNAAFEEHADAA